MRIITIKEFSELTDIQKKVYESFIDASYFNCFEAVDNFLKYRNLFSEKKLFHKDYKNAAMHNQNEYVKAIGTARHNAIKSIKKLPILHRFPLEFFDEYSFPNPSIQSEEILLEFRYQKSLAHGAFLFR